MSSRRCPRDRRPVSCPWSTGTCVPRGDLAPAGRLTHQHVDRVIPGPFSHRAPPIGSVSGNANGSAGSTRSRAPSRCGRVVRPRSSSYACFGSHRRHRRRVERGRRSAIGAAAPLDARTVSHGLRGGGGRGTSPSRARPVCSTPWRGLRSRGRHGSRARRPGSVDGLVPPSGGAFGTSARANRCRGSTAESRGRGARGGPGATPSPSPRDPCSQLDCRQVMRFDFDPWRTEVIGERFRRGLRSRGSRELDDERAPDLCPDTQVGATSSRRRPKPSSSAARPGVVRRPSRRVAVAAVLLHGPPRSTPTTREPVPPRPWVSRIASRSGSGRRSWLSPPPGDTTAVAALGGTSSPSSTIVGRLVPALRPGAGRRRRGDGDFVCSDHDASSLASTVPARSPLVPECSSADVEPMIAAAGGQCSSPGPPPSRSTRRSVPGEVTVRSARLGRPATASGWRWSTAAWLVRVDRRPEVATTSDRAGHRRSQPTVSRRSCCPALGTVTASTPTRDTPLHTLRHSQRDLVASCSSGPYGGCAHPYDLDSGESSSPRSRRAVRTGLAKAATRLAVLPVVELSGSTGLISSFSQPARLRAGRCFLQRPTTTPTPPSDPVREDGTRYGARAGTRRHRRHDCRRGGVRLSSARR